MHSLCSRVTRIQVRRFLCEETDLKETNVGQSSPSHQARKDSFSQLGVGICEPVFGGT